MSFYRQLLAVLADDPRGRLQFPPRFPHPSSVLRSAAGRCGAVLLVCGLTACGSLSTPPEQFHTLRPAHPDFAALPVGTANPGNLASIVVGPVRVPGSLDRPQWLVRQGNIGALVLEQHRWEQGLDGEIGEAIAANLSQSLGLLAYSDVGDTAPPSGLPKPAVRVEIRVLKFDTVLAPNPGIDDQLQWTVHCAKAQDKTNTAALSSTALSGTSLSGVFSVAQAVGAAPWVNGAAANQSSGRGTGDDKTSVYDKLAHLHAQALSAASQSMADKIKQLTLQCSAG